MSYIHVRKQSAAYQELQERTERAEKIQSMVVTMTLKKQIMVGILMPACLSQST